MPVRLTLFPSPACMHLSDLFWCFVRHEQTRLVSSIVIVLSLTPLDTKTPGYELVESRDCESCVCVQRSGERESGLSSLLFPSPHSCHSIFSSPSRPQQCSTITVSDTVLPRLSLFGVDVV